MTQPARQKHSLDRGWLFHLGDVPSPVPNTHIAAYMYNKAGWAGGAARRDFDDSDWRSVDLPHDWAVEGKFDPDNHVDQGFLPRGVSWYRRHFRLEPDDRGKYLAIQFDGVAVHCTVYVNGHIVHRNFCGYTPFAIDISDVATFGDELNVITIRVDADYMEGWWYEGAGIYRHVWLIKAAPVHVAPNGIFVCPLKSDDGTWNIWLQTTVESLSNRMEEIAIKWELFDCDTNPIAWRRRVYGFGRRNTLHEQIETKNPHLWSIDDPHLYSLRTTIWQNGVIVDECLTRFGFRTIRFDAEQGFFLNDKPVKLKGTCNHQDHAGVGVAVPDSIQRFRIQRLIDMGSNAIRCAHNPPAPELLDACDELGMLVMDENRSFGSSPEHLAQLESMIRRDRNHPSVILWSICNEESIQGTPVAGRIARSMQHFVQELDPSRPVIASVSGGIFNDDCIADSVQIMGINYQPATYEPYHAKHPTVPLVASETHCALSTRGVYQTDASKFVFDSYDDEKAFWGTTARDAWRSVANRPFVAGLFAWTGFDYRGEPSPHAWPCVNSHWGILDTCGFAKDSFYLHKAFFTSEPFVHLLPHWNWPGHEGKEIRVMVCTNCDAVELFLNGESLGRKLVDPIDMANWQVPYRAGELKAIGYFDGAQVADTKIETTGAPAAIGLEIHPSFDRRPIPADGEFALPISVFATDSAGRRVPTADSPVAFSISGPAMILGVGNGDPSCHEPDKASSRSLFNGLAQVIVQTTRTPGLIRLGASSPGLVSATLEFASTAASRVELGPATVRHIISDWRMSPITANRPDPHQIIHDSDMNSWERINPSSGPQRAWQQAAGFALYRATIKPPRIVQANGGRVVFNDVRGESVEIFFNGHPIALHATRTSGAPIEVPLAPGQDSLTITVLVSTPSKNDSTGLAGIVEIVR